MSLNPSERTRNARGSESGNLDLRGLSPEDARIRAFSGMFKFRPGQRVSVLVDSVAVEKAALQWASESGHRFIRESLTEEDGKSWKSLEIVKMEARR